MPKGPENNVATAPYTRELQLCFSSSSALIPMLACFRDCMDVPTPTLISRAGSKVARPGLPPNLQEGREVPTPCLHTPQNLLGLSVRQGATPNM